MLNASCPLNHHEQVAPQLVLAILPLNENISIFTKEPDDFDQEWASSALRLRPRPLSSPELIISPVTLHMYVLMYRSECNRLISKRYLGMQEMPDQPLSVFVIFTPLSIARCRREGVVEKFKDALYAT